MTTSRAEQFATLPAERVEHWSRFGKWNTVYFPQLLGLQLEEVRLDYARMRLPYKPEFRQPAGVVHGGVIATLLDTVVVPAVGAAYEVQPQLFTIDMQLRFLAPVVDEDMVAEGWVVRRGRQIVYLDAEVCTASGTVVATATLVYKVSSRPQQPID
jgi:uncharacterized protein (TIGR00369 family)